MHLKKNANQTLINFLNSHKPNSWLLKKASQMPLKKALIHCEQSYSFLQLALLVQGYANYWHKKLADKPTTVALLGNNSLEYVLTILALFELGIKVQFLNPRLTSREIVFQLNDAGCEHVICTKNGWQDLSANFKTYKALDLPEISQLPVQQIFDYGYRSENIASIMYTSGTTGHPKGVGQCFKHHKASALATKKSLALTSEDCWLCILPLYHIGGLAIILRMLICGCSVYLVEKFQAEQIQTLISTKQVTLASVVTKMLQDLAELLPTTVYPANFKTYLLGGGPVAKDLLLKYQKFGVAVMQSYGMTETCSQICALPAQDALSKLGSAGRPLEGVYLKISAPQKDGIGEIWLKGSSIISNYLGQKKTTDWLKTGDLGYLDQDGFLYLVSRQSELIISGGENIYPTEIEHLLQRLPQIKQVAVVGQKDPTWGQVPVAFLTLKTSVTKIEILDYLTSRLAKYKFPKAFFVVKKMPMTASNKIQKYRFLTDEKGSLVEYEL